MFSSIIISNGIKWNKSSTFQEIQEINIKRDQSKTLKNR